MDGVDWVTVDVVDWAAMDVVETFPPWYLVGK